MSILYSITPEWNWIPLTGNYYPCIEVSNRIKDYKWDHINRISYEKADRVLHLEVQMDV